MNEIILMDNEFVTLKYHQNTKIIHHQFHEFVSTDTFKNCLLRGVAAMKQYGSTKWLSDDRKNGAIPKEDVQWSLSEWQPMAMEAGWRYWAIVVPEKVVGQMTINRIIKDPQIAARLNVKLFDKGAAAYEWLAQQ